jgi:hypothetical protein
MNRRKSDRLPILPLDGPVSHRSHERSPLRGGGACLGRGSNRAIRDRGVARYEASITRRSTWFPMVHSFHLLTLYFTPDEKIGGVSLHSSNEHTMETGPSTGGILWKPYPFAGGKPLAEGG